MIKVSYRSVDNFRESRSFKTLEGAQAYAQKWIGKTPEVGTGYAVSGDGIGRITVTGATLLELFPETATDEQRYDAYLAETASRIKAMTDEQLEMALDVSGDTPAEERTEWDHMVLAEYWRRKPVTPQEASGKDDDDLPF